MKRTSIFIVSLSSFLNLSFSCSAKEIAAEKFFDAQQVHQENTEIFQFDNLKFGARPEEPTGRLEGYERVRK